MAVTMACVFVIISFKLKIYKLYCTVSSFRILPNMRSKRKQKFNSSELHTCKDELITNGISFERSSISTRQLARRNALQNSHLAICESANVDGINEQPILNMDIPHNKDAMSCEKGMMIDTAPQMGSEKRGVVFKRVGSFSTTNSVLLLLSVGKKLRNPLP